ncbi:MAG: archease [Methanomassiliicoccaceae archaeon]|nr:archease [Methanomassiliicoccaceae archaeon]
MRYETLEHTADILVRCNGRTMEECFGNAAYAMFDQMIDVAAVEKKKRFYVTVEADDIEDRLYLFLSELLYMLDAESSVMSSFAVTFSGNKVLCESYGETLDKERHMPKTEIKAVTYHMMEIDKDTPSVTVLFDV